MNNYLQITTWSGAVLTLLLAGFGYSTERSTLPVRFSVAVLFSLAFLSVLIGVFVYTLTGGGFDDAFWYHLRNSKSGISVSELAAGGGLATFIAGGLLIGSICLGRRVVHYRLAGVYTILLLTISIALSPMTGSAFRQLRLGSNGQAIVPDGFQSYRPYQIPAIKKNLVLIYAESLERTYFDDALFPGLVPNLKRLARTGLDFTDLRQVPSQGYTLAGLVASQTGVPFVVPSVRLGNAMSGVDLFYPGAEGFGQVLKSSGYRLVYLGGADSRFAGKDKFLRQNGYDEVSGLHELSHLKGDDPADGWGLHDDTLLRIAKERIVELSASKQPYVLTLLTLDTHFPTGRVAPSLRNLVYRDGSNPMLNAVHAADVLLSNFINEIKSIDKSGDVVIVLMSDHLSMLNTATEVLERGKRRNMMLIFDPDGSPGIVSEAGTLFDAGPTIMSRLGFMGGFGLGVDLLTESRRAWAIDALIEPSFLDNFESFFQAMWQFPKFAGMLTYEPKTAQIGIGERRFRTPVLCKIDDSGNTRFYFEFDTYKPTASISTAFGELSRRDKFFYVGDWRDAPTSLKEHRVMPDSEKVVIWGRVGDPVDVRSLSQIEIEDLSLASLLR